MPSFNIHLAIAKRYISKNKVENLADFYNGSVAPDLTHDKTLTHYGLRNTRGNLRLCLEDKVNLAAFLEKNKVETDFEKGVFLHLLTDYLFYTSFFENSFLKNNDYNRFGADLFYSYDLQNKRLIKKYGLHLKPLVDQNQLDKLVKEGRRQTQIKQKESGYAPKNILNNEKLDSFIEEMASTDINYTKKRF